MGYRTVTDEFLPFFEEEEGRELKPYKDSAGRWTIGIGHLMVFPADNWMWNGITNEQCEEIFQDDMQDAYRKIHSRINGNIINSMSDSQYAALCSLVFNVPISIYDGTIDNKINSGVTDAVLEATWKAYNKENKNGVLVVNAGLSARRGREWELWMNKKKDSSTNTNGVILTLALLFLAGVFTFLMWYTNQKTV